MQRKQVANLIFTTTIIGIGIVLVPSIIKDVAAQQAFAQSALISVGVEWAAEQAWSAWSFVRDRISKTNNAAGTDLDKSFKYSLDKAIESIEKGWWQSHRGKQIAQDERILKREIDSVFGLLRDDINKYFGSNENDPDTTAFPMEMLQIDKINIEEKIQGYIRTYFDTYDPQLLEYVESSFFKQVIYWFGEYLTQDKPESTAVWRKLQRILLENLVQDQNKIQSTLLAIENNAIQHTYLDQILDQTKEDIVTSLSNQFENQEKVVRALFVELSNDINKQIQEAVKVLTGLPTDFSTRIERFIREYIGTQAEPVSFGGRGIEIEKLENWIDLSSNSPYLLLTASAGRGKSALLVHWSQQLAFDKNTAVVFIPVSIRFRTNLASVFFMSLVSRLAYLHNEPPPSNVNISAETLRSLTTDYFSRPLPDNRRLVVIIDGIDEAADWAIGADLFPNDPPKLLKVVVSGRLTTQYPTDFHWLQLLEWTTDNKATTIALPPLDVEGVAEVVASINLITKHSEETITEIFRLTKGDPLLVRLYVDWLKIQEDKGEEFHIEILRSIKPGIEGYFDRWWQEQRMLWGNTSPLREKTTTTLLNLLSGALGPLSREDIFRLSASQVELNSWNLNDAFQPITRFVISDDQGSNYVFSHPLLANFFWERLTKQERTRIEEIFLEWGADTIKAFENNPPLDLKADPYIVQYYSAHLIRNNSPIEELVELVSEGWLKAWESFEGSYIGYVGDVERVWSKIEKENNKFIQNNQLPLYLSNEVKCALTIATINSILANIPNSLLLALVKNEIWSPAQGLSYAKQIPNLEIRIDALFELHPLLHISLQEDVYKEILRAISSLREEWIKINKIEQVIPNLPKSLTGIALHLARQISNPLSKSKILALLSLVLDVPSKDEVQQEALNILKGLGENTSKDNVFVILLPALSEKNQIEIIEEIISTRSKSDRTNDIDILAKIIPFSPDSLKKSIVEQIFKQINDFKYNSTWVESVNSIIPHLSQELIEFFLDSSISSSAHMDLSTRAELLSIILPVFPDKYRQTNEKDIIELVNSLEELDLKLKLLSKLLHTISEEYYYENLLNTLKLIRNDSVGKRNIINAIANIMSVLPGNIRHIAIIDLLRNVRLASDSYYEKWWESVIKLKQYIEQDNWLEILLKTIDNIREIQNDDYKIEAIIYVLPYADIYREELIQYALTFIHAISVPSVKYNGLIQLSAYLSPNISIATLKEILQETRVINDEWSRLISISAFAKYLTEKAIVDTFLYAEQHGYGRDIYWNIIPYIPDSMLPQLLLALRVIETISHSNYLARLAPRLSPDTVFKEFNYIYDIKSGPIYALEQLNPWLLNSSKENVEALIDSLFLLTNDYDKSYAIRYVWKNTPDTFRLKLLDLADTIESVDMYIRLMIFIIPNLDLDTQQQFTEKVIERVKGTGESIEKVRYLVDIYDISLLSDKELILVEALNIANNIEDTFDKSRAIYYLIPMLPNNTLPDITNMAKTTNNDEAKLYLYSALISRVDQDIKDDLLEESLKILENVSDYQLIANILNILIPFLSNDRKESAIEFAISSSYLIEDLHERFRALLNLSSYTNRENQMKILQYLLTQVEEFVSVRQIWAKRITDLIPLLPDELFPQILDKVRRVPSTNYSTTILSSIFYYLPNKYLIETIEIVQYETTDYMFRTSVQHSLVQHLVNLPSALLYQAWLVLLRSATTKGRATLLTDISRFVPIIEQLGSDAVTKNIVNEIRKIIPWIEPKEYNI